MYTRHLHRRVPPTASFSGSSLRGRTRCPPALSPLPLQSPAASVPCLSPLAPPPWASRNGPWRSSWSLPSLSSYLVSVILFWVPFLKKKRTKTLLDFFFKLFCKRIQQGSTFVFLNNLVDIIIEFTHYVSKFWDQYVRRTFLIPNHHYCSYQIYYNFCQ